LLDLIVGSREQQEAGRVAQPAGKGDGAWRRCATLGDVFLGAARQTRS
jgi:hypothetical protein